MLRIQESVLYRRTRKNFHNIIVFHWAGLPTIFHVYAHYVPAEERSRAFGYLIAAGGAGQTVAAVVSGGACGSEL